MNEQPPSGVLLQAASEHLARLSRMPSDEPLDSATRYELRILANLTGIVARELGEGYPAATALEDELEAAVDAMGLDHLGAGVSPAAVIDRMLRAAVSSQDRQSADGSEEPMAERQRFHDHLLDSVERRLDIQRPGYRQSG